MRPPPPSGRLPSTPQKTPTARGDAERRGPCAQRREWTMGRLLRKPGRGSSKIKQNCLTTQHFCSWTQTGRAETRVWKRHLLACVHSSIRNNSDSTEAPSVHGQMDGWTDERCGPSTRGGLPQPQRGRRFRHRLRSRHDPGGRYIKQNEPDLGAAGSHFHEVLAVVPTRETAGRQQLSGVSQGLTDRVSELRPLWGGRW